MINANNEVIVRQKRMEDARLRPAAGEQQPRRPKLRLNFDTRGTVSVPRVKRRSMLKVVK